jgi:hypothetical protein
VRSQSHCGYRLAFVLVSSPKSPACVEPSLATNGPQAWVVLLCYGPASDKYGTAFHGPNGELKLNHATRLTVFNALVYGLFTSSFLFLIFFITCQLKTPR